MHVCMQAELRSIRTDTDQFCNTRPMGEEVLDFLSANGLESYATVLLNHDVDTLSMIASLGPEQVYIYCSMYIYIHTHI